MRNSVWPPGPAAALAILLVVVVGPLVQIATAQPLVRFAQTAALVEHGSLRVDPYQETLLVDRVDFEGHVYSDKAPLQAFLAVPVYAAGKAVGMGSADVVRPSGNLGLWWMTLWSSTLPAAGLVLLMHRACRRVSPGAATPAVAALAFGTLLLPFAGELYGHVLCALLAYGAWTLIDDGPIRWWTVPAAGALAGASVSVEYPMVLVALILAVAVLVLRGVRALGHFCLGAVPFGAFLLWYHWAAFGDPLTDPYRLKPQHADASAAVTGLPRPAQAVEVLLGSRGLWLFAPVTAVGVIGLVLLWKRGPGPARPSAAVGLAVFVALWAMQSGWSNPWGGEMPGPRYMIAALPFLAPGVAAVGERWAGVVRVAGVWGLVAMVGPLLTVHLVFDGGITGLSNLENFRFYGASPALPVLALGDVGWLVYGVAVVLAVTLVVRSDRLGADIESAAEEGVASNSAK